MKQRISCYLELSKARLSSFVVMTTAAGYVVALPWQVIDWWHVVLTVVGTTASAFGANILNQWWEVERDSLMERTKGRPLPAGKIERPTALLWGLTSAVFGCALLWLKVNPLTAMLAIATVILYVLIYTPLKAKTTLATLIGAVCGAIPPLMGWTAATGTLDWGGWLIGGLLFVWQIPHFLALAWMYSDDYSRGGFVMLPSKDPDGLLTARVATVWSLVLLPISVAMTLEGLGGAFFLTGSLILASLLVERGLAMCRRPDYASARRLFLASLLYLPLVLALMVLDGPLALSARLGEWLQG